MAKIRESFDVGKITEIESFMRFVSTVLKALGLQINGGLEFGENIKSTIVDVVFPAGQVEVAITHGLGRIPIGFLIANRSTAANIYSGTSKWTSKIIYLRASSAVNAKVVVI